MIRFKNIKISNFLSFGKKETSFDLDSGETILFKGDNQDTGTTGDSKNGTGKSSLFNAVMYALFGEGIEKLKQDEFVNFTNGKKMYVQLTFEQDGHTYTITRGRKPTCLELWKDNIDLTRDSNKNTDETIQQIIGMNSIVFLNSYLLTNATDSFLSLKPAEQRNFMEVVLSLDTLSQRAETLKTLRSENKVNLQLAERDLEHAKRTFDEKQSALEESKRKRDEFEQQQNKAIQECDEEIQRFDEIIKQEEEQVTTILEEIASYDRLIESLEEQQVRVNQEIRHRDSIIDEANKGIQTIQQREEEVSSQKQKLEHERKEKQVFIDSVDVDHLENMINKAQEVIGAKQAITDYNLDDENTYNEIERINNQIDKLNEEKNHLQGGTCPYCEQRFVNQSAHQKIDEIDNQLKEFNNQVLQLENRRETIRSEINEYEKYVSDFVDTYGEPDDVKQQNQQQLNDVEKAVTRLENVQSSLDNLDSTVIVNIEGESYKNVPDLEKLVDEKTSEKEKATTEKDKIQEDVLSHQGKREELNTQLSSFTLQSQGDIEEIKREKEASVQKKEQAQKDIQNNPHEDYIHSLESNMVDPSEYEEKVSSLQKEDKHYNYLIKMLSDSKSFIRKNIIEQYVPYLNKQLNSYLHTLDSSHYIEIQSDLSVYIEYLTKPVSYFSMSRGERLRANLSASLAFRDLLGMLGVKTNLLMVDEFFDSGLDRDGTMNTFKIVKDYTENVLLVSHRDDFDKLVDRTVTIEKKNGFTRLVY